VPKNGVRKSGHGVKSSLVGSKRAHGKGAKPAKRGPQNATKRSNESDDEDDEADESESEDDDEVCCAMRRKEL
jgi:hypothetical protein